MTGEIRGPDAEPSPRRPDRPPLAFSTSARTRSAAVDAAVDADADADADAGSEPVAEPVPQMPARPEIDEPPPPVRASPIERPKMLWIAVVAWIASFVIGLGAIALTLVHGAKVRSELATKVHHVRPSLSTDAQKQVASTLLSASAIVGAILVVVQLLFVHRLWARRRRTRIVLFILGALNLALLFLFEDALRDSVSLQNSNERLNALGHAAMIVFAMVTMLWPSVGRWIRRESAFDEYDEER